MQQTPASLRKHSPLLFINIEKCDFLAFNTAKSDNVSLVNHFVPAVPELKYLGFIVFESLNKQRKAFFESHNHPAIKCAYGIVVPNRGR